MKIRLAVIAAAALFGAVCIVENSSLQARLGSGFVASAQEVSGKDLFMQSCSRCHGDNGEGGKGPNLTTAKKQAKWKDSDASLVKKITNGGLIMPAFGKKLTGDKIKAIAAYVRTLPLAARK